MSTPRPLRIGALSRRSGVTIETIPLLEALAHPQAATM